MKTISLQLHCSAAEAYTLIEILDRLRETIALEYEEEIQWLFADEAQENSDQFVLPFDDPIEF